MIEFVTTANWGEPGKTLISAGTLFIVSGASLRFYSNALMEFQGLREECRAEQRNRSDIRPWARGLAREDLVELGMQLDEKIQSIQDSIEMLLAVRRAWQDLGGTPIEVNRQLNRLLYPKREDIDMQTFLAAFIQPDG